MPAFLGGKRVPPGTRAGITSPRCLKNAYALSNFFFFFRPGKETGVPGEPRSQPRLGPHRRPVLPGCLRGGAPRHVPSQGKGV